MRQRLGSEPLGSECVRHWRRRRCPYEWLLGRSLRHRLTLPSLLVSTSLVPPLLSNVVGCMLCEKELVLGRCLSGSLQGVSVWDFRDLRRPAHRLLYLENEDLTSVKRHPQNKAVLAAGTVRLLLRSHTGCGAPPDAVNSAACSCEVVPCRVLMSSLQVRLTASFGFLTVH